MCHYKSYDLTLCVQDPYFMKNHLGTYECKLCLTLHTNEGSYLAHTQVRTPLYITTQYSRYMCDRASAIK